MIDGGIALPSPSPRSQCFPPPHHSPRNPMPRCHRVAILCPPPLSLFCKAPNSLPCMYCCPGAIMEGGCCLQLAVPASPAQARLHLCMLEMSSAASWPSSLWARVIKIKCSAILLPPRLPFRQTFASTRSPAATTMHRTSSTIHPHAAAMRSQGVKVCAP